MRWRGPGQLYFVEICPVDRSMLFSVLAIYMDLVFRRRLSQNHKTGSGIAVVVNL